MFKSRRKFTEAKGPPKRQKSFRMQRQTIKNGEWSQRNYSENLKYVETWSSQVIIIQKNISYNLLAQILHIYFPNLRSLILPDNQIQSIEGINNINAPFLKSIDLSRNHITSFKGLRKFFLPNLQILHLQENNVHQTQIIVVYAYLPKLSDLSFDYYTHQKPIFQDISSIVKLESPSICQLYFDSHKRIIQKQVMKVLHKRYLNAQIAQQLMTESEDQASISDDFI